MLDSGELTEKVIGAAMEVHKTLGPGLLESVYEECLDYELRERGIAFARQVDLPISYKGVELESGYRLDFVVGDEVVVEIKSVEHLNSLHEAQLLTYLRLSEKHVGLLINFGAALLKDGILRRVV